jgi:dTDP-glucose 4,6-dehydratase
MGGKVQRAARKGQASQPVSVVTGGAGFLGSHLVDRLLQRGHRVMAVDNLVTGSVDNIAHLAGNQEFRFIEQDVTEFLFVDTKVDYVWHFASPASPVDYLELPIQTLKVGSLGTHKALGLALHKSAKFLLASTSEIYGDPLVHPQVESYWGNVNPIGLRLRDGRVVPAFISQALKNRPLTVFGNGGQTRSFCYCSDLIEGICRLMGSRGNAPVNIGNPAELTMLQFAREIIAATGSRSRITFRPLPQDDPRQRRPDIARARKLMGWEPRVALADGLVKTIAYFRAKIGL